MFSRSTIRLGLTGALLLLALGFAACADSPTSPTGNGAEKCVWIEGVMHCAPGD